MILALLACSEFTVQEKDPTPPADPPGLDPDADLGQPPDWSACQDGWYGQYYNLPVDHPDVEPPEDEVPEADPEALDWWSPERLAYRDYVGNLDFGAGWYPVDEGLEGDPDYFSARWTAWVRAWSATTLQVTFGTADDGWVLVDKQVAVARPGVQPFEPETFDIPLAAGQYPVDLRFAQRAGEESAFRFRVLGGDVTFCYPDFSGA